MTEVTQYCLLNTIVPKFSQNDCDKMKIMKVENFIEAKNHLLGPGKCWEIFRGYTDE